jgi:hypothetical protein
MKTLQGPQLVGQSEARRFLGIGKFAFARLVDDGLLAERRLPHGRPKYLVAEIEALVQRCTRRARAPGAA